MEDVDYGHAVYGHGPPWSGGEVYFDPEIAGGEGFGGVKGIAGFTNGEIPRVGTPEPQAYVARLFYRQSFDWGARNSGSILRRINSRDTYRIRALTVSLGKFAASDFFDNNTYSHDPAASF